jgi:endogenous inhibitor of DNA gyrase (YacG/DUF329 family)
LIDLGQWAAEKYRVPVEPAPNENEAPDENGRTQ